MSLLVVQIGEPPHTLDPYELVAVLVCATAGSIQRIVLGDTKLAIAAVYARPHPHLVVANEWEDFLVCNCIDIAYDQEPLVVFNQLRNVFTEERERRIGRHDVRLLQQLYALVASKITVSFEWMYPLGDFVFCWIAALVRPAGVFKED